MISRCDSDKGRETRQSSGGTLHWGGGCPRGAILCVSAFGGAGWGKTGGR